MTKLDELLSCIRNPHVYIQMHNYPDQDAIASAMGLKILLETKGKPATIVYHGIIDKDNTLLMIDLLNIELHPIETINFTPEDEIIIVDGQKGNINMHDCIGNEIACIDHHKKQNTDCYLFYDIRSDVGACSSIITSYFIENNIRISTELATALLYGQRIDTSHMTRNISDLDIDMCYYLYKIANHNHLKKFEVNAMNANDLQLYQRAISDLRIYNNIGISNVGIDCPESMIGTISDFLLTLSEVDFTLLYSYRAGGLKFSVRTSLEELDASEIIRSALSGYGDGGGHQDMAAGFIPNIKDEDTAMNIARKIERNIIVLVKSFKDQL